MYHYRHFAMLLVYDYVSFYDMLKARFILRKEAYEDSQTHTKRKTEPVTSRPEVGHLNVL